VSRRGGTVGAHLNAAAVHAARLLEDDEPLQLTEVVAVLRDDVRDALRTLLHTLIGEMPGGKEHHSHLDTHPAWALAARLRRLPHHSDIVEGPFPAPSDRLTTPPTSTTQELRWREIAAHLIIADHILSQATPAADQRDADGWTTVGDVAVIAEAFALLDRRLLRGGPVRGRPLNRQQLAHARARLSGIAAVARDTAAQASGIRTDDLTRQALPTALRVISCTSVDAVAPATRNLGRLLTAVPAERLGVPSLAGAATALARLSHSVEQTLSAAVRRATDSRLAEHLAAAAVASAVHRDHLESGLENLRALATPHPGEHSVRIQAGQLSGEGCRFIRDAASIDPVDVAVRLLHYPAAAATATDAVAIATGRLAETGLLFARAAHEAAFAWTPAGSGSAATRAVAELRAASQAARGAPLPPASWQPPLPPPNPVTDLRLTLARSRIAARAGRVGAHGPGLRR
jgi:hypothetical protein